MTDWRGRTLLHYAAASGIETVNWLNIIAACDCRGPMRNIAMYRRTIEKFFSTPPKFLDFCTTVLKQPRIVSTKISFKRKRYVLTSRSDLTCSGRVRQPSLAVRMSHLSYRYPSAWFPDPITYFGRVAAGYIKESEGASQKSFRLTRLSNLSRAVKIHEDGGSNDPAQTSKGCTR